MPIFQDDLDQPVENSQDRLPETKPIPIEPTLARRISEESIRTELCEGPIPDVPDTSRPATPEREVSTATSDRAELIERLKRGESPTWIPNRHLESIFHNHGPISRPRSPRAAANSPTLLPPAAITSERVDSGSDDEGRLREGLEIERPRSALHSGDFTPEEPARGDHHSPSLEEDQNKEGFPPSRHSWLATSPPRDFSPFQFEKRSPLVGGPDGFRSGISSLSSSLSSSFVYKPPTSPLVQSESNEDVDLSVPLNSIAIDSNSPMNPRRHTLTSATSSPFIFPPSRGLTPNRQSLHRREGSMPYQAHQPRRSLNSTPNISLSEISPQTPPFLRSRRPSFSSDASPLQHASMVGSYEESILRGRMSTTPSKPLDFLAQIGVLGLGNCKSRLRCPPHVTLPFPAVFYSYSITSHVRSRTEDGPSPYVGQIDLENGLPNPEEEMRSRRKARTRYSERMSTSDDVDMAEAEVSDLDVRKILRPKRRSGSPRAPPGGSYRIPEKGQIQIVIKNQNKTAVKLFLVPYDLAGMEPGTKTFIRQRSYSAGPIVDNVPSLSDTGADRPILRYLVHLHICCPSKGRFYLYKSIRIVFANRVPDGKEKLRNETTWPEPRFTPYKAIRVMHPSNGPGATLAAEKAFRRRSSGWSFGMRGFDAVDGVSQSLHGAIEAQPSPFSSAGNNLPVDPIPFRLPSRNRPESDLSDVTDATTAGLRSPGTSEQDSRPVTQDSSATLGWGTQLYEKLNKGDVGYGGNAFAPTGRGSPGAAEGLLSQRLRSLGVQTEQQTDESAG